MFRTVRKPPLRLQATPALLAEEFVTRLRWRQTGEPFQQAR